MMVLSLNPSPVNNANADTAHVSCLRSFTSMCSALLFSLFHSLFHSVLFFIESESELRNQRRYMLQHTALELFLVDGTTLFLAFTSKRARNDIRTQLLSRDMPNYVDYSNTVNGSLTRDSITAQWSKGAMSNFE